MNHEKQIYTVSPSYCTGNNDDFEMPADDLRKHLIEDLGAATEHDAEMPADDLTLERVFALGDDNGDWVRFDVTRPGCLQSTLTVHDG